METTDKAFCRELAALLTAHGVEDAVLCPGSRNAPLIVALSRQPRLRAYSVIDERSAAFIALGIASITGRPAAVVCTSGTAVLNFAPAVAEAYYRRIPLIAISADRPAEWIDQDDSQTIRQTGVLANIVKNSYEVPVETGSRSQAWYANRTINDALLMAQAEPRGPVHINVGLDMPLHHIEDCDVARPRKIAIAQTMPALTSKAVRELTVEIGQQSRILVIAGFMPPDHKLSGSLCDFASRSGAVIMSEAQANVHCDAAAAWVPKIDSALSILTDEERKRLCPELVITIGGSLVSRFVKKWLRECNPHLRHWHVGCQPYSVDCFMHLEERIEMPPADFLSQLCNAMPERDKPSDYQLKWQEKARQADTLDATYAANQPWSDYKAMQLIMRQVPEDWNVQFSNGTAIRYAQLFPHGHMRRIDCNRGVSGIDGCASTAVGAQLAYDYATLLVTGDMSMQYDVGALAASCISPRLKIAVLNNGGGGIFRFVDSTASLPERDGYFCCDVRLPLRDLARGYGFAYFEASTVEEFMEAWPEFANCGHAPAILNLVTPPELSAEILRAYFQRGKQL